MKTGRLYDGGIIILIGLGIGLVCHWITYEATSRARVNEVTTKQVTDANGQTRTVPVYRYPDGYGYAEYWRDDTVRAGVSLAAPVAGSLGIAAAQGFGSGGGKSERKTVTGRDGQGADIRTGDNSPVTLIQASPTTTDNSVRIPAEAPAEAPAP